MPPTRTSSRGVTSGAASNSAACVRKYACLAALPRAPSCPRSARQTIAFVRPAPSSRCPRLHVALLDSSSVLSIAFNALRCWGVRSAISSLSYSVYSQNCRPAPTSSRSPEGHRAFPCRAACPKIAACAARPYLRSRPRLRDSSSRKAAGPRTPGRPSNRRDYARKRAARRRRPALANYTQPADIRKLRIDYLYAFVISAAGP